MGREARANQQAETTEPTLYFSVPVSKSDDEKRLVSGIATAENVDRQGDIVDYETAKAFFTNRDLWPGNIREMHKAEAVGSAVDVTCDDATKSISVTAHISEGAPNTWTKVKDGTLKFFSIGGSGRRVIEKIGDTGKTAKRLFLEQLAEVSLVDNPANPLAKINMVKSVDGSLVACDADAQDGSLIPVAKVDAALDAALDVSKAKKNDGGEKDDKNKTSSGEEGKWYAGTDGKSFPISTAKDVANAARALGRTKQDRAKVKANIIRIAYAHDLVSGLPEAWKKKADQKDAEKAVRYIDVAKAVDAATGDVVEFVSLRVLNRDGTPVEKSGPEPYDIDQALAALSFLNRLMSTEYWEARCAAASGDGDAGTEKQQVAMLKAACDAVLEFLQSEYEEQFAPDDSGVAAGPAGAFDVLDLDDAVEMFVKGLALVQKAGARHSAKDQEMVQKIHDVSNGLGAVCKDMSDDDVDKILKFVARPKVDQALKDAGFLPPATATLETVLPDDVKKLATELDTTKAALTEHQATVATQAETIAKLEARLSVVEGQPAAGGPARSAHAVEKTLGSQSTPTADGEPPVQEVMKALDALTAQATSDEERTRIATLKLSYRRANNLDAVDPISGRAKS